MFVFVNNNFVMSYLKEKQGPTKTHNLVLSSTKLIFLIYIWIIFLFFVIPNVMALNLVHTGYTLQLRRQT